MVRQSHVTRLYAARSTGAATITDVVPVTRARLSVFGGRDEAGQRPLLRLLSHGHPRRPCGGQTASRAWGRGRDAEGTVRSLRGARRGRNRSGRWQSGHARCLALGGRDHRRRTRPAGDRRELNGAPAPSRTPPRVSTLRPALTAALLAGVVTQAQQAPSVEEGKFAPAYLERRSEEWQLAARTHSAGDFDGPAKAIARTSLGV